MICISVREIAHGLQADLVGSPLDTSIQRVVTDSRVVRAGDLFVAIRGDRLDGHDFVEQAASRQAVVCLCSRSWFSSSVSAGVRSLLPCMVVEDTIDAIGRLATYYRREVISKSTIVIAITGSNGKTTTKAMLDHVLAGFLPGRAAPRSFNNHLGVPLTLLSAETSDRYLIVEIGSNAPGEVAALADMAMPDVGVVTSVGLAHLEGLGSIEGVAQEKTSLLRRVRSGGLSVANTDCEELRSRLQTISHSKVTTIGMNEQADLCVTDLRLDLDHTSFTLEGRWAVELPISGAHHATNAACAFAVARWCGIDPSQIVSRLLTFEAPPGRARVTRVGGVTLVDDTYNANPTSVRAAAMTLMRCASGRKVFVLGDMGELGCSSQALHRATLREIIEFGIDVLVTIGPESTSAVRDLHEMDVRNVTVACCQAAEESLSVLAKLIQPGDTVWLKGSRAMGLDSVSHGLSAMLSTPAAVA